MWRWWGIRSGYPLHDCRGSITDRRGISLGHTLCTRGEDLLQELSRRSAAEGLALISWTGVPINVITFEGAAEIGWRTPFIASRDVRPVPFFARAWFGTGGDVVAWNLIDRSQRRSC